MNIKDFVFDAVYQYFDTHDNISSEKFFSYIDMAKELIEIAKNVDKREKE